MGIPARDRNRLIAIVDRDRLEGRLARVSPTRLAISQVAPLGIGSFFLVANLASGRTVWAVVFGALLVIDAAVVAWWILVKLDRRRDAEALRGSTRRG